MARKRTDEELADAPKEMPSEMEDKIYGKSGKKKGKNDGMLKKGPYIHKKLTKEQEEELRKKMMPKLEPDRPSGKKMTPEEKRRFIQLANDRDPGADQRMMEFERTLREAGLDDSKMKDGGVARGRGNKIYQHNYATGGQVVDHLSKVTGHPNNMMGQRRGQGPEPTSVQAATAVPGESPAERSKRLRRGG